MALCHRLRGSPRVCASERLTLRKQSVAKRRAVVQSTGMPPTSDACANQSTEQTAWGLYPAPLRNQHTALAMRQPDELHAKADSTLRCSQAVPHPSTNRALRRLTSEVRRDPVHSTRYGRRRSLAPRCIRCSDNKSVTNVIGNEEPLPMLKHW